MAKNEFKDFDVFPVVPLCDKQLRDVRPEDVLNGGLYRKCVVYKSGGGYDKFPDICQKRLGRRLAMQFVVQLWGCPCKCPYCYVTEDGVWGEMVMRSPAQLVDAFLESGQSVFHLMGGAPAMHLRHWSKILDLLPEHHVFHSDFLLQEGYYEAKHLKEINRKNTLYCVSLKGVNSVDHFNNTRTAFKADMFWENLDKIVDAKLNFYFTLTNPAKITNNEQAHILNAIVKRYGDEILEDMFIIDLKDYKALEPDVPAVEVAKPHCERCFCRKCHNNNGTHCMAGGNKTCDATLSPASPCMNPVTYCTNVNPPRA
jgi:pyruvate-formate lyase-activating enzyme